MTRDEFERNLRRFGEAIDAWPAPHRQEALDFLAGEDSAAADEDEKLDRLVLEAAAMRTDEHALARQVLARVNRREPAFLPPLAHSWLSPMAMAASVAVVLAAASAAGYAVARIADDQLESAFMALATGAPRVGDIDDLAGSANEEDAL